MDLVSPEKLSFETQPKNVTLEYYLKLINAYWTSKLPTLSLLLLLFYCCSCCFVVVVVVVTVAAVAKGIYSYSHQNVYVYSIYFQQNNHKDFFENVIYLTQG